VVSERNVPYRGRGIYAAAVTVLVTFSSND